MRPRCFGSSWLSGTFAANFNLPAQLNYRKLTREDTVDTTVRTSNLVSEHVSAVSWASIAAGGVASAALSLALLI
jgi:hypothetical protein